MTPVIFINCKEIPFLDLILSGEKTIETRSRDTLKAVSGFYRVYLAETGHGRPVVRCSAVLRSGRDVSSRASWDSLRRRHRVPVGSRYDWKPETRRKVCYDILSVVPCDPFTPPEGVRHGRVWMEYNVD